MTTYCIRAHIYTAAATYTPAQAGNPRKKPSKAPCTHIYRRINTHASAREGEVLALLHTDSASRTLVKNPLDHILIRSYRRISPCVYLHARPHLHPPPFPSGGSARARTHVDAHTRTYARKIFVKIRRCGYTESAVVDNPHEISSLPDAPSHPRLHLLHTSSTSSTSSTSFSSFSYHPLSLVVANLSLGEKVGKEWGGSIFTGATVLLLLPHAPSCIHIALPPPTFPSLFPHILYFSELAMLCPVPVVMHRLRPG